MESEVKSFPVIIVLVFLVVIFGLFLFDYDREVGFSFSGKNFFGNTLQALVRRSAITPELLSKTSLKEKKIITLPSRKSFFDPYLDIPKGISASFFQIADTALQITETDSGNPFSIIEDLLKQSAPDYEFHRINQGSFYLNQIPEGNRTGNFLGIIIHQTLYGFQYRPSEHPQVLEIIDALSSLE